jgi:hypothetical protein
MSPNLEMERYDALTRQLERMRAMQYAYFQKFFSWIILSLILFLVLWLLPYLPAQLLLPFLVVTAGVQASFYLHFVDFSRVHARALERKLNQVLGEKILVGSELEDAYFYPILQSKISGVLPLNPTRFFSAYTLHWCGLWTLAYGAGLWKAWEGLEGESRFWYVAILLTWTAVNVGYLTWFFWQQLDLRRVAKLLDQHFPPT